MYDIEISFGTYVKNATNDIDIIPDEMLKVFKQRIDKNKSVRNITIDNVLEEAYIKEIFDLAAMATGNTSLNPIIKEVMKLAEMYGLYEIRNCIAHPNRQFSSCYWYKLAAFASDPIINMLGITQLQQTIEAAENGDLTEPPEEWLGGVLFEIKNNLPSDFEHEVTGLIGRSSEAERLLDLLKNPRVNTVSVIAPGGYGKTSLVLDLLNQQVKTPETAEYADAIIFVSLKMESLSIDGIKQLNSAKTIDELKNELSLAIHDVYEVQTYFKDFDECKEFAKDEKLIVCIDNMETLLRDDPDAFNKLNLEFPISWRVIVTSRTSVGTSQSIRLEPLVKKHAQHLIIKYLKK